MATTLTSSGEVTVSPEVFVSFPIEKTETTADGDILVYGKATDGSVDSDQQIVSPEFSSKAIAEWLETGGNVRVQHNPQLYPAGVGVEANTDASGATWVKSLIGETNAKKLVSIGALRAYSVGIARPTIERDVTGKARGGIITGGQIVEISLVDRPANKSCGIQLVKSADDGGPEFTGKMFGDEAVIAKFIGGEVTAKFAKGGLITGSGGSDSIPFEPDMSLTFTPNDLAKILKNKIIDQHYEDLALKALYEAEAEVYKRDVSTAERRSLASEGNALPNGSYPIANTGDLGNAAHLAATGHGDSEAARRLIARRAKELGVANPLDSDSSEKGESVTDASVTEAVIEDGAVKEAEPEVTKDPADGDGPGPKDKKMPKKGKKLPPWLNQNKASSESPVSNGEDDDDADDKSATAETCKLDHAHTEKCMPSGTPQSTSGAVSAPMEEMPDPNAYEYTPMPAGRRTAEHKGAGMDPEAAAMLRFKSIGIDTDLGRLHDLTCPAFDPDDVFKYHPFASLSELIDEDVWMRKAVDAATGPIGMAIELTQVWGAVQTLKSADMADLNDYRRELHKAFRDANPGVSSYPTPGSMSPKTYCRPVITAGHAANSPSYGSPNTAPAVASGPPNAHSFNRPPLSAGHQTPSPSFMKNELWDGYPAEQGTPSRLHYAIMEKENARRALSMLHDHLNHMFPSACPMLDQDAYRQPEARDVPPTAGVGKDAEPQTIKADVDIEELLSKGMKKKLARKVLSGTMTVDEARAKLGRRAAQKSQVDSLIEAVEKGVMSIDEARARLGLGPWENQGVTYQPEAVKAAAPEVVKTAEHVGGTFDPEVIKSAVEAAVAPLLAKIDKQEQQISEQEARWEKAASEADPRTASWTGLAPSLISKNVRPAGVAEKAEAAERAQQMIKRQLHDTWRTSENAYEREAAWNALAEKYGFPE